YTKMFWIGQVLIGGIVPLFLIYSPAFSASRFAVLAASVLVLVGGFFQIYVIVIGGQAFPMTLFPGKEVVESSFFDGMVNSYVPTLPEAMLGFGGVVVAMTIVAVASRMLPMLPDSLEDPDSI
ncbi:MAG: polysulfide reductase NrfD, partial [Gammaproteobacteria bacterium]|nr:polysulfide reductase NrfD [Gammaproteobacteria bacterium]